MVAAVELRRTFDPIEVNIILNDPSVFPTISVPGLDFIDITPVIEDERNIVLMVDRGCLVFSCYEPGTYEVHTNFLKPEGKTGNGPYILNACLAAYRWMFTKTDCLVLLTKIPAFNRAAIFGAPLAGWTKQFERKAVWPTKDGPVDMSYWMLPYLDWVRKTPDLINSGKEFHNKLELEFLRHGKTEKQHQDDDCHDLHVGACAEMLMAGQLNKAVALYNGWARFADYGTIELKSHSPAILDIGNALLQITADNFKVIMVR